MNFISGRTVDLVILSNRLKNRENLTIVIWLWRCSV